MIVAPVADLERLAVLLKWVVIVHDPPRLIDGTVHECTITRDVGNSPVVTGTVTECLHFLQGIAWQVEWQGLHGQEAESLRQGIEQIVNNTSRVEVEDAAAVLGGMRKALVFLLDHVDARPAVPQDATGFDVMLDPLPSAYEAIRLKGVVAPLEVMNLSLALITAHTKVDQLYKSLENRSVALALVTLKEILRKAKFAPGAAAYRDLHGWVQTALEDLQAQANGDTVELELDNRRLDYLAEVPSRFADARRRMIDRKESLRDAIDFFMGGVSQKGTDSP